MSTQLTEALLNLAAAFKALGVEPSNVVLDLSEPDMRLVTGSLLANAGTTSYTSKNVVPNAYSLQWKVRD